MNEEDKRRKEVQDRFEYLMEDYYVFRASIAPDNIGDTQMNELKNTNNNNNNIVPDIYLKTIIPLIGIRRHIMNILGMRQLII